MPLVKSTFYKIKVTSDLYEDSDAVTFYFDHTPTPSEIISLLKAEQDGILAEVVKHGPKKLEGKVGVCTTYPLQIAGVDIGEIEIEGLTLRSQGRRKARR